MEDILLAALEASPLLKTPEPSPSPLEESSAQPKPAYTRMQGQYLAFIYHYTKVHGYAPAEADMQYYFQVTPPSVHQMVLRLEKRGFISREPGQARSIKVLLSSDQLPELE
jgi:repressor LexA